MNDVAMLDLTAGAAAPPLETVSSRPSRSLSAWYVVALIAASAAVFMRVGPLAETDVFWHIRVGQALVDHTGFPRVDPFSYTLPNIHWKTTAWLSEVLFYGLYRLGGAAGINALRLVLVSLICALLARQLLPNRTPWVGTLVFSAIVLPLSTVSQERPQLISFVFLIWLANLCHRVILGNKPPRLLPVIATSWLWANLHGYWVFAPAALALSACVLAASDLSGGRRLIRACLLSAVAAVVAAMFTPFGPGLIMTPLTISSAARGVIQEWAPTAPLSGYAFGLGLLIIGYLWACARSREPIPREELLWVVTWAVFGYLAMRNVAPAMLLIGLPVAHRINAIYGSRRREPLVPLSILPALALPLIALIAFAQSVNNGLDPNKPAQLASVLRSAHSAAPLHVLDDYNVSGYLLLRAGDRVRVAIDGRSERYGNAYITKYLAALNGVGWRPLLHDLRPDVAVLQADAPLVSQLVQLEHWKIVRKDGSWILLSRPGLTL